jgi:hypothetical protein
MTTLQLDPIIKIDECNPTITSKSISLQCLNTYESWTTPITTNSLSSIKAKLNGLLILSSKSVTSLDTNSSLDQTDFNNLTSSVFLTPCSSPTLGIILLLIEYFSYYKKFLFLYVNIYRKYKISSSCAYRWSMCW